MLKKKTFFNHEIFAIKAEISEINKNCKTQCSSFFLQDLQPGMGVLLKVFFLVFKIFFLFFCFFVCFFLVNQCLHLHKYG